MLLNSLRITILSSENIDSIQFMIQHEFFRNGVRTIVSKVVAHHKKNSLHNLGIYKWVNSAPIFFSIATMYFEVRTTYGPQQFAKFRVFKVDYFDYFVLPLFLVPKLRSVAQIEWKNPHMYFFLLFVQN